VIQLNLISRKHMRLLAGKENVVRFSHLSVTSAAALQASWQGSDTDHLENELSTKSVEVTTLSVMELMKERNIPLEKVCLLDPKAMTALGPEDGDGKFQWFLFGVR